MKTEVIDCPLEFSESSHMNELLRSLSQIRCIQAKEISKHKKARNKIFYNCRVVDSLRRNLAKNVNNHNSQLTCDEMRRLPNPDVSLHFGSLQLLFLRVRNRRRWLVALNKLRNQISATTYQTSCRSTQAQPSHLNSLEVLEHARDIKSKNSTRENHMNINSLPTHFVLTTSF